MGPIQHHPVGLSCFSHFRTGFSVRHTTIDRELQVRKSCWKQIFFVCGINAQ